MTLFVVCLVALAVGGAWVMYNRPEAVARREMDQRPIVPIQALKIGDTARIAGVIRDDGVTLSGPLSGEACVWFEVEVEESRTRNDREVWDTILKESSVTSFIVEDTTGSVVVRSPSVEVIARPDRVADVGTFHDATEAQRAFLAKHDLSDTGSLGLNRRLRFTERTLSLGERVSVIGRVTTSEEGERIVSAPEGGAVRVVDA